MTIPSSQSLILWISVFSITSPSADFGRLRKTSDFFGRLRTSSGIFGNDRVISKNPSTRRIKISRLYVRKSWHVYTCIYKIFHLHIAIRHFICPPKFCITFAFHFSWVLQPPQEKLKTMLVQNLKGGGANKAHYGKCASGVWAIL